MKRWVAVIGLLLGMVACGAEPPVPVQLGAFPAELETLIQRCDAEDTFALRVLCDQEVAIRHADDGHFEAASARCTQVTDAMWAAECHFLIAERMARQGELDAALASCLEAPTFLVNCVEHVAALQTFASKHTSRIRDIRRYTGQATDVAKRRLAPLPSHQQTTLLEWIRLGRVQSHVLGKGTPDPGLGTTRSQYAAIERTVRAMEVARGMGAGAPFSTVHAAYSGQGTWPVTKAPIEGCIAVAEPVDAALGRRTPVWGNMWRRMGRNADEDAAIALLVGMFWAGTTDLTHLQATVRRETRPAVAWTALHLARHLVVQADEHDLRDLIEDARRHPDPGVRAYANRPLPPVNPLPRVCVGRVPGQQSTP